MEKGISIKQIKVGDKYETTTLVTDEMIANFARATGDDNPLHLDEAAAAQSIFKKRVAHGMLTAGFLSALFGTKFPGMGTIYLEQTMKFLKPVFPGDVVTCRVEAIEVMVPRNRVKFSTLAAKEDGEAVMSGQALVMPPL